MTFFRQSSACSRIEDLQVSTLDLPSITSTYNNINIVLNLTQDLSYLGDKLGKPLNQIHPKKQI